MARRRIGLGLKEPVNSFGVLLQAVTNADVLLNYQWHFIPALFFIALVLAFVFVGDGLRDHRPSDRGATGASHRPEETRSA